MLIRSSPLAPPSGEVVLLPWLPPARAVTAADPAAAFGNVEIGNGERPRQALLQLRKTFMGLVCPNCASQDVSSLSLIHREGSGALAQAVDAAPPSRRNVLGWTLIVVVGAGLFLLSIRRHDVSTMLYGAVALVGVWMVKSNRAFNATRFPELYNRWQQSFRCNRCGSQFLAS